MDDGSRFRLFGLHLWSLEWSLHRPLKVLAVLGAFSTFSFRLVLFGLVGLCQR